MGTQHAHRPVENTNANCGKRPGPGESDFR